MDTLAMDCGMENIKIDHRNNLCILCGHKYKHSVRYIRTCDTPSGLKEAVFVTSHATCRHLMDRKRMLERLLTNVEYDIYMIKNM